MYNRGRGTILACYTNIKVAVQSLSDNIRPLFRKKTSDKSDRDYKGEAPEKTRKSRDDLTTEPSCARIVGSIKIVGVDGRHGLVGIMGGGITEIMTIKKKISNCCIL